jgi:hypothetical protein
MHEPALRADEDRDRICCSHAVRLVRRSRRPAAAAKPEGGPHR